MSTAKKSSHPKKEPVQLACTVTQDHTKIGAMPCLKGTRTTLPEDKASALEKLGKIRIDGVA